MKKFSKFNVLTSVDNGFFALYNTATLAFALVKDEQRMEMLGDAFLLDSNKADLFKLLCDNQFVLDEEVIENEIIDRNKKILSNDDRLSLVLLPTMDCNFACVYCYENHSKSRFSESDYVNILNYIKSKSGLKNLSISWFGGEPLLELSSICEFLEYLIEYCNNKEIVLHSNMTTNGYLLSKEVFSKLVCLGITEYQITLDGLDVEHDRKRVLVNGRGTFARIIDNLQEIKKLDLNYNIIIRYNYGIESDIDGFCKRYVDLFGGDRRFRLSLMLVQNWSAFDDIAGSDIIRVDNEKNKFDKMAIATRMKIELANTDIFRRQLCNVCHANVPNSYVITPEMKILKCTVKIEADYNCVGSLDEKGVSLDIGKLDKWIASRESETCRNCAVEPLCLGKFCPHRVYENDNTACQYRNTLLKQIEGYSRLRVMEVIRDAK